jgi:hypothetical protein
MRLFSTVAASDRAEATIYLAENLLENISAATAKPLGDTKNRCDFPGNTDLRINTTLFTQPRPI